MDMEGQEGSEEPRNVWSRRGCLSTCGASGMHTLSCSWHVLLQRPSVIFREWRPGSCEGGAEGGGVCTPSGMECVWLVWGNVLSNVHLVFLTLDPSVHLASRRTVCSSSYVFWESVVKCGLFSIFSIPDWDSALGFAKSVASQLVASQLPECVCCFLFSGSPHPGGLISF